MPEREVRQALATYVDEDGATRYALEGETVTVHPDHVKQFDEPNAGGCINPRRSAETSRTPTQNLKNSATAWRRTGVSGSPWVRRPSWSAGQPVSEVLSAGWWW